MKQALLKDILIVFCVWFVVAYVASGFPISLVPNVIGGVILVWLVGTAAGTVAMLAAREWMGNKAQRKILNATYADDDAEATIMDGDADRTLFHVPMPFVAAPAMGGRKENPAHTLPWWAEFATKHPAHAEVVNEAYAVMQARPDLPAGVDKHQGVTLIEHSVNVMESMLALAPSWKFDGVKNAKGKIIAPLIDSSRDPHTFGSGTAIEHPILVVAAFTHDIGKVTCLVMEDGEAKAMLPGHGEKGAALLRTMPSVAALPMGERDALLMAVKYYHHLSSMPLTDWIGDRTRSLTALLYVADCSSAYNKARGEADGSQSVDVYAASATVEGPPEATSTEEPEDPEMPEPNVGKAGNSLPPLPPAPEPPPKPRHEDYTLENGATPLDLFTDLLDSPEAINSKARERRLGWKHGQWAFIDVNAITLAAADLAGDRSIVQGDVAKTHFMLTLLRQLASKGWLYLGARSREPESAIWRVASSRTAGHESTANAYAALVVRSEATIRLAATADCPVSPRVIDADGGWREEPEQTARTPAMRAARNDVDELDSIMNGFASELKARGKQTKERDMVARSSDAPALSFGVLVALAAENTGAYGLTMKTSEGSRYASFDAKALGSAFAFDPENVPSGIRYVAAQDKMWVRLP